MDLKNCKVYFTDTGYYIEGGGVQVYRDIRRKMDDSGNPTLDQIHHNYFVLIAVMQELRQAGVAGRIQIYHDTRIIDDINGVSPLDDFCEAAKLHIQRRILPEIPGTVWFMKCPLERINESLTEGRRLMTGHVDPEARNQVLEKTIAEASTVNATRRESVIKTFKADWFGEEDGRDRRHNS